MRHTRSQIAVETLAVLTKVLCSIPDKDKSVLSFKASGSVLGPKEPLIQRYPRSVSVVVNQPGREADHLSPLVQNLQ